MPCYCKSCRTKRIRASSPCMCDSPELNGFKKILDGEIKRLRSLRLGVKKK